MERPACLPACLATCASGMFLVDLCRRMQLTRALGVDRRTGRTPARRTAGHRPASPGRSSSLANHRARTERAAFPVPTWPAWCDQDLASARRTSARTHVQDSSLSSTWSPVPSCTPPGRAATREVELAGHIGDRSCRSARGFDDARSVDHLVPSTRCGTLILQ
ncbi:uncharacterized protein PSFLO_00207 [Pseudozyma flocculosa]|uniref:Uncharacterized protein n=1 Tax=Pseudozyma flocculosa TaxID=84751 RepID=A0A5C3ET82_9BASI|nr:uncharacterized protein PSFLO_00207 [Pseudozyma flocculosa]